MTSIDPHFPEKNTHSSSQALSYAVLFGVLLICSMFLNVFLGWQIRRIRQTYAGNLSAKAIDITGTVIPKIEVSSLDGKPSIIDFVADTRPTVLYVFHPKCGWCARNLDNLKTLVRDRQGSYQFIGLSLDDPTLKQYVESSDMGFPAYKVSSYRDVPALRLRGTPETIVIAPGGKVEKVWDGAYVGSQKKSVESYFAVKLPGLVEFRAGQE